MTTTTRTMIFEAPRFGGKFHEVTMDRATTSCGKTFEFTGAPNFIQIETNTETTKIHPVCCKTCITKGTK